MMRLFLIALLFLGGCDQVSSLLHRDKTDNTQEKFTKVGVLMSDSVKNPFFASAAAAFKQYGDEHPLVSVDIYDAKGNQQAQFQALDQMIQSGVQAVVINMVDASQGQTVIDKVAPNNIPVVFFNRSPGDAVLSAYNKALFVDGDAVQGGVLQGLDVLEQWEKHPDWDKNHDQKIQYAMLKGIPGNPSAEARTKWAISTMESYPEKAKPVEEITIQPAMFSAEQAFNIVNGWINDGTIKHIEVILSNNDAMAIGAVNALKKHHLQLPVFGIDAISEAKKLIEAHDMAGTVFNDAKTQAEVCLQTAVNLANDLPVMANTGQRVDYQTVLIPYQEYSGAAQ